MRSIVQRLLYPLIAIVFLANIYAQSVNLRFIEYPTVIIPEKLHSAELSLKLIANVSTDGYKIVDPTLYIQVTREDGKLLYYEQRYISLGEGVNVIRLYLPGNELIEKLNEKDGIINVNARLLVTFANGTKVVVLSADDNITIPVKTDILKGDVDVVYISPNLTKYNEFERKTYTFVVGLKNEGKETIDNLAVYIRVYDIYNVRKINMVNYLSLNPGEYLETRYDINFGVLEPGYYTFVIEVYKDNLEVFKKTYPIVVSPRDIKALAFYDLEIVPPRYKPGDLIVVKMLIRNILDKAIVVKPEIISNDLNIYRTLSSFTLEPREVKEFKVVIPLPENISKEENTVTLRFVYDGFKKQEYKITLNIPIKKPKVKKTPITVDIYGPKEIEIGKNATLTLKITSLVEDLIPLKIEAYANYSDIKVLNKTIYVGGTGLSREAKIILIGKSPGEDTLLIKLINTQTGEIITTLNYKYTIAGKEITATLPKEIIAIIIVIVIIVLAILLLKRKGEEEKPSE